MPDRLVISNTSPLLYLHQIGCLDLLKALYGAVVAPPAVERELHIGAAKGINVPDLSALSWVKVRPVKNPKLLPAVVDLGPGEAEVIALGLENPDSLLILDDKLARRIAGLKDLSLTGTLGVLTKARKERPLEAGTSVERSAENDDQGSRGSLSHRPRRSQRARTRLIRFELNRLRGRDLRLLLDP